jgi:hypothetical protein
MLNQPSTFVLPKKPFPSANSEAFPLGTIFQALSPRFSLLGVSPQEPFPRRFLLGLGNPFPLFGTVLILRVEEFFDARSKGFVDFLIRRAYRTLGRGLHIRWYLDGGP